MVDRYENAYKLTREDVGTILLMRLLDLRLLFVSTDVEISSVTLRYLLELNCSYDKYRGKDEGYDSLLEFTNK